MVRVEAVENFSLQRFKELKNIARNNLNKNQDGMIYAKDKFECTEEMADYLEGNNPLRKKVAKIIEYMPNVLTVLEEEEIED